MKNRFPILILFLQLLTFCKDSPDFQRQGLEIIDVVSGLDRKQPVYLSSLAESINYVPLSGEDMPGIRGVTLFSSSNKYMLISDLHGCYLFDTSGLFVRKVGNRGRGPGELPYIGQIAIGEDNRVFIYCLRKLYEFDINGVFLKAVDFYDTPSGNLGGWIYLNDGTFLVQVCNDSGSEKYKSIIIDAQGKVITRFQNYMFFEKEIRSVSSLMGVSSIYSFDGSIRYKGLFNDTLFALVGDTNLAPILSFNLGRFKATPVEYFNNTTGRVKFNREHARIYDIFETEELLFFDMQTNLEYLKSPEPIYQFDQYLSYYTTRFLGVYDKSNRETYFVDITRTSEELLRTGLFNDIDGGPKFYPRFRMGDNKFAMPIQAFELKKYVASESFRNATAKYPEKKKALEELASSLSNDDNPVLMVGTMKK